MTFHHTLLVHLLIFIERLSWRLPFVRRTIWTRTTALYAGWLWRGALWAKGRKRPMPLRWRIREERAIMVATAVVLAAFALSPIRKKS